MSNYSFSPTGPTGALPGIIAQDIGSVFKFKEGHMFSGLDIRITPAHGGTIISVSQGTNNTPTLYVVGMDQDLGAEIGKIVTLTCLTKEA